MKWDENCSSLGGAAGGLSPCWVGSVRAKLASRSRHIHLSLSHGTSNPRHCFNHHRGISLSSFLLFPPPVTCPCALSHIIQHLFLMFFVHFCIYPLAPVLSFPLSLCFNLRREASRHNTTLNAIWKQSVVPSVRWHVLFRESKKAGLACSHTLNQLIHYSYVSLSVYE